jgi:hypothetical protein
LLFHSARAVLFYYVVAGVVAGIVLSVVSRRHTARRKRSFRCHGRARGASSDRGLRPAESRRHVARRGPELSGRSFRAGMASHFRWLRRMGRPNAVG